MVEKVERKAEQFEALLGSVRNCSLCDRMCNRKKVLSNFNGSLSSKVMFIAEAPGRLGAECTGIPLFGDRTGDNFELLLNNIGWDRKDVFVTNAILCNPQDESGNNSTPTRREVQNCSAYLAMTIKLVDPDVIVTLGVKALEALKAICPHDYTLKEKVSECVDWNNRKLVPLYHMGPRALIHRNMLSQRADFIKLSHLVDPRRGMKPKGTKAKKKPAKLTNFERLAEVVNIIVSQLGKVSMFKTTKLIYLADYRAISSIGKSLTGSTYLRMQEGPWIPSLANVAQSLIDAGQMNIEYVSKKPFYASTLFSEKVEGRLTSQEEGILCDVIARYGSLSDGEIKTCVYLTKPMRAVLKIEKKGGDMTKSPIIYQDRIIVGEGACK